MKSTDTLQLFALSICMFLSSCKSSGIPLGSITENNTALPQALVGAWELISYKSSKDSVFTIMQAPDRAIKIFTPTHFTFAYFNPVNKKFEMSGGGTYTLQDSLYVETVQYFSLDNALVGKSLTFTLQLNTDTLYQLRMLRNGTTMKEYWKKVRE